MLDKDESYILSALSVFFLLTLCARTPSVCEYRQAGTVYANIIARIGICVYCIQSRACAYFWFLSVWEWENIHIAHLGSSWQPIEPSYWKTPCCFFGRA